MRIGASVWILLSEKPLFIGGARTKDPFKELYDLQYGETGKKLIEENIRMKKGERRPAKSFLEDLFRDVREIPDVAKEFLESPWKHLHDKKRLHVELSEIREPSDKVGETEELSSFGLWKIEALDVKKGGPIQWEEKYRLKHLVTGMYLSVLRIGDP